MLLGAGCGYVDTLIQRTYIWMI